MVPKDVREALSLLRASPPQHAKAMLQYLGFVPALADGCDMTDVVYVSQRLASLGFGNVDAITSISFPTFQSAWDSSSGYGPEACQGRRRRCALRVYLHLQHSLFEEPSPPLVGRLATRSPRPISRRCSSLWPRASRGSASVWLTLTTARLGAWMACWSSPAPRGTTLPQPRRTL